MTTPVGMIPPVDDPINLFYRWIIMTSLPICFRRMIGRGLLLSVCCWMLCGTAASLDAAEKDVTQLLLEFQREEPEVFERVRLVEEDGRQMLEISLRDVLYLALKRSVTIETSRMAEQTAQMQTKLVDEMFQSQLKTGITQAKTASLSGHNLDRSVGTLGTVSPYLTTAETNSTVLSAVWSKKNRSGWLYSATMQQSMQQSKVYTMADEEADLTGGTPTDDPLQTTKLSVGVSIPFFQDSGEINELAYRRAELGVEQSRLSTYSTTTSLLKSVAQTYWNLVGIRENIKTLREAVELSEQLVKETRVRVEVGILSLTDLKEAEIRLATNRQNLLSAMISQQEIEDQIRVALDLQDIPYGFKPENEPKIHAEDLDFKALLEKTYQNNADLQLLEISLQSNRFDLEEALNDEKTNLDLDVSYSMAGYGASTGESFQNITRDKLHGYQLGLSWTVPLFDRVTPEKIAKAKLEKSRLELRIRDVKSQLAVSLQTLVRNLKFGEEEEKSAILSRELAEDLLDKEVEKLRLGKSTGFNVSQIQQQLTSARYSETMVRVKNEQTFLSLLTLTGQIYDYYDLPRDTVPD